MGKQVLVGLSIIETIEIGGGKTLIKFNNDSFIIGDNLTPLLSQGELFSEAEQEAKPKADKKGKKQPEPEPDDDEDNDEDELSIADMKEALLEEKLVTKKALKDMDDDEIIEMYNENFGGDEDEDENTDEDEDDLTAEDLKSSDFDDLEDIIDDRELDIDIEDYDADDKKSVEKLRKAIAKELEIKY